MQRNAGAVAEEVQRLHVTGIIVAAAFVEGDEDGGVWPTECRFACTASTIFSMKPSNKFSFEEDGWPSTKPLGLTKETAGKCCGAMSLYRSSVSLMWRCGRRCWP